MNTLNAFFILLFSIICAYAEEQPEPQLLGKTKEVSLTGKAVVLKIGQNDLVNGQAFEFWKRILDRASEEQAAAIVLEIDTPGGLAMDTRDIIMDHLVTLDIPLYAWVSREALSAGALIAFAADAIYMAEGTTIGSAAIVNGTGQEIEKTMRAKLESAFSASMRAVAEKKGHNYEVIQAMMIVEKNDERKIGNIIVKKGELLNLTAKEATQIVNDKPLLAKGIASSVENILKAEGLHELEIFRPQQTGFEKFAWHIAAISPLLLLVGISAAYMEFKAPGFGIFGLVSLIAFSLFFFGNNVAGNLAGYELMAVFMLGIILIIIEIFLLPGFVAGAVGALLVIGSLWFAMADKVDFERVTGDGETTRTISDLLVGPAFQLVIALLGTVGLAALFLRFFPSLPLFRGLIIQEALPSGVTSTKSTMSLIGQTGITLTDLRPSGSIEINGETKDALSKHGLIEKGKSVTVIEDGMRLVVEKSAESN